MLLSELIKYNTDLLKEHGDGEVTITTSYRDRCGDMVYNYEPDFYIELITHRDDYKFLIDA